MNKKTDLEYLNYQDLNEIENAIEETTNYIKENYVSGIPTFNKKTWILNELPFIQEIDRIEKGVENLGLYYLKPNGWLLTKKWITKDNFFPIKSFDYRDYNRWINNIEVIQQIPENDYTLWNGNSYINWNEESDYEWIDASTYKVDDIMFNNENVLFDNVKLRYIERK